MADIDKNLSEEQLRLLMDSMSSQFSGAGSETVRVVNTLIKETVKFRDKLKEQTGDVLTVGDTRVALEALGRHLDGGRLPRNLSPEQKALTQIWIDRLTLFGSS